MHISPTSQDKGFTVTELLIVTVVIIALVTIAIVSHLQAQDKADAAKTADAVQAYKKALLAYKADKDVYPTTGAFCLGDQYTPFAGSSVPSCGSSLLQTAAADGASARDGLKPYLDGQLPMPSTNVFHSGTTTYTGARFMGSAYTYKLDGKPVVAIEYYVKGSRCPAGPVYADTSPNFSSPTVTRTKALADGSSCFLLLAN